MASGLDRPWDLAFAPDGTLVYTERPGRISALVGGRKRLLNRPFDVVRASEAGMMGMALDPAFAQNRFLYACFASTLGAPGNDVRLARFKVNAGWTAMTERRDILTGLPVNTAGELGRHSGCRPRFGPDGYLWVGTGDAAEGPVPQNRGSLGGKVLRIDRNGAAAPGNLGGFSDRRIFSYGHRNVQGIAFRADGLRVSVEHGPGRDDELNPLVKGNFGWDPVPRRAGQPAYNEAVPMTDLFRFPAAVRPIWASGVPTVAPSGATFLSGSRWGDWNGAVAVALLKAERLAVFKVNGLGGLVDMGGVDPGLGRLRTPVQGPDGNLYVTTDNAGGQDRIVRLAPR